MQRLRFKADDGSEFPEWEEKNVEDVCSVSTGKGNTQDKVDTGAYRFYVRSPIIEHSDSYLFDEEAVITVGDGVGTGKVFHYVKGKYNLHQRCYRMYDFRDVTGKYFYYFFSTNFYRRVKSMSAKTSVDSVRMEMITKMKILVPCLAEQQKIAEFLSTIDTVIAKQRETVFAWEERKKGVMQKLFSQEVRFKADDGSDFPEWENVTVLDLLVQPITDGPHETPVLEENGVSFVSVEAIDNGRVNLTKRRGFISKEYDNVCAKKYKPQLYDVYMVKSGATTGKVAIVTITDDFNIWSPLAAMRTSSKIEAFFLYYQLQSDMIQNQVWTKLSLGNQPNLGMRALELFSAVRPCFAEQQKIADCLSSLDEVIEKRKATLAAWEELKKGLLQQMFV